MNPRVTPVLFLVAGLLFGITGGINISGGDTGTGAMYLVVAGLFLVVAALNEVGRRRRDRGRRDRGDH